MKLNTFGLVLSLVFGHNNKMFNTILLAMRGTYALDYLRSNVVKHQPFRRNFGLYKNYFTNSTGFSFQFNRYVENNTTLIPFKDSIKQ